MRWESSLSETAERYQSDRPLIISCHKALVNLAVFISGMNLLCTYFNDVAYHQIADSTAANQQPTDTDVANQQPTISVVAKQQLID